mgnify:CR=1 FL=1
MAIDVNIRLSDIGLFKERQKNEVSSQYERAKLEAEAKQAGNPTFFNRDKGIFATRQLAKRQLTWLRSMQPARPARRGWMRPGWAVRWVTAPRWICSTHKMTPAPPSWPGCKGRSTP